MNKNIPVPQNKKHPFLISLKQQRELWLLCVPIIIWAAVFCYYPMYGLLMAFVDYAPGRQIWECTFVGLKYFKRFVLGADFPRLLRNTLAMSSLSMTIGFVCPIIFAFMLNEIGNKSVKKFVQTASYLPHFISWVIVYGLVYALFTTEGPVNQLLAMFGTKQNLLMDRDATYIFQSLLYLWKVLGWNSIIYVAAIAGIDQQLYEAATIDGAGHFRCALHVTLPGILPTFVVLMLLGVADFVNNGLDQYYVFQNAFTYNNLETLEMYTYKQGMKLMDYSYATAVGILKSGVSITLLFVTNAFAKKVRGNAIV